MLHCWLLYIELTQFSVQRHIQSLLWVILHVQLIIVVSVIVLSPGSISTWYQSHCRLFLSFKNWFAGSTSVTGSLLLTVGTDFRSYGSITENYLDSLQFIWMESRDGGIVESERPLQGDYGNRNRAQCSCREDKMAQQEGWGLCYLVSEYIQRTSAPLELIHNDVSGPFPHMSMS